MNKIFSLFVAALAAMTLSATELTLDLNSAKEYAQTGFADLAVSGDMLNVLWDVEEGWSVAGAAFELDDLTGVSKITFDYMGDDATVDMLVWLEDAAGNKFWDSEVGGLSLKEVEWTSIALVPNAALWTVVSEGPWTKLVFVANPATPTIGQFALRDVRIEYTEPTEKDIALDGANWGWGYNSTVDASGGKLNVTIISDWGAVSTGWDPEIDLTKWDKLVVVVDHMDACDGEWFKLKAYLRDKSESETNQLEATLGLDAADNEQHEIVINLKQEKEGFDITKCRILAVQCQPTGATFTISRVYLAKEGEPEPVAKPEAAPEAPTRDEANVMALYSSHYTENNLNFGLTEWGGTAWKTLDLDGTNVLYTEGLTWEMMTNWDYDAIDFSDFESFHCDLWVPGERYAKVTFEAKSGWKQGVYYKLDEGWNSIDDVLASWCAEVAYDWKDVKYIAFEGYKNVDAETIEECTSAEGTPFAFANLYFWKSTTGVENVATGKVAVKRIINGQVVIEKNGVLYNVLGAQF